MTPSAIVSRDLLAALEDRGYRMTGPRRRVLSLLSQKQEGFSAEEVWDELPGIGRATVYRTIRILLESGVICRLALPDGGWKYSLSRAEHHHHTVCVECGTVGEFRNSTVERVLRAVGADIPGKIVGHRIEVYITCNSCLQQPGR